tara:strand:+ start:3060 stop:3362 length:303 start_codon:yes stop_codon:yes gene_type:complete
MYKKNDIVLVKSRHVLDMPLIHVKLLKKHVVKPQKGNSIFNTGYVGWDAALTKPKEAAILRKKWSIPYEFPNDINLFVFNDDIVKKVKSAPPIIRSSKKI